MLVGVTVEVVGVVEVSGDSRSSNSSRGSSGGCSDGSRVGS
jgi:hypothetical protein